MGPSDKNFKHPRQHKRRKINLPVQIKLRTYDDFIAQYITDISAGGLYIVTPTPYELGDEMDIEFYLEQQKTYFFKVRGIVARLHDNPKGMGIKFTEIEESSQTLLEQLLARIPTNA